MKKNSLAALAAAAFAVTYAWQASAQQQTVKIGVILTYSGPLAEAGDEIDKGLSLYAKMHGNDLPPGVRVEIVRRDDTGPDPEVARRVAQDLVTHDHVDFLSGVVWSPNALAIAPVATESKTPFVVMNAAAAILPRTSPYIVRESFTLWQVAYPLGVWAAKHGMKRAMLAVSDYAPGHDAAGGFAKGFTENGGTVLDTVKFPLQNPDFVPFLQRVKAARPQALFIFVPAGPQSKQMMKAYDDLGLRKAGIGLLSTQDLVPDNELPGMGTAPLGLITSGTYSGAAPRPSNRAFQAAWKKEYGGKAIADFLSVQGWDGMAMIFDAIKKTGGKFDGDQAMAILKNYRTDRSPRGPFMIDPETRDVVQNIYIRRVDKKGDRLVNTEFETFPMVQDPWEGMNPLK
jgi:branched-chain amino acid transport system substrate-binding protein